jgi:hypothetical protein
MQMKRTENRDGRPGRRKPTAAKPKPVWSRASLYGSMAMLPVPGRMIVVRVPKDSDRREVSWRPVVGLVAYNHILYRKELPPGQDREIPPGSHEELVEDGYQSRHTGVEIHPVCYEPGMGFVEVDGYAWEEDEEVRQTVVACTWPPEQDRAHAIRIGRALLAGTYNQAGSASLDDADDGKEEGQEWPDLLGDSWPLDEMPGPGDC